MKGSEFHGKNVPPQVLEYPLNNVTQVFVMRKMFERQKNKENPIASTFANSKEPFPQLNSDKTVFTCRLSFCDGVLSARDAPVVRGPP